MSTLNTAITITTFYSNCYANNIINAINLIILFNIYIKLETCKTEKNVPVVSDFWTPLCHQNIDLKEKSTQKSDFCHPYVVQNCIYIKEDILKNTGSQNSIWNHWFLLYGEKKEKI